MARLQITAALTASLDRRRREYRGMGWVYVMRNPAFKAPVFKIGLSRRYPTQRAEELTRSTGVFGSFQLLYFVHVNDCCAAEADAHRRLAQYRVSKGKEFFQASLAKVLDTMDGIAASYPLILAPRSAPRALAQPFLMYQGECNVCKCVVSLRELLVPVRPRCRSCGGDVSVPISV